MVCLGSDDAVLVVVMHIELRESTVQFHRYRARHLRSTLTKLRIGELPSPSLWSASARSSMTTCSLPLPATISPGPANHERPVQAGERCVVEVAFHDIAPFDKLAESMGRIQLELTSAVDIAVAVSEMCGCASSSGQTFCQPPLNSFNGS